jgi:hypothetical protein
VIPKDYGFAPGGLMTNDVGIVLAQPAQLKRLFNRIRPTFSITGATNAKPIVITTKTPHFLADGDTVTITAVEGNPAANGDFTVTSPSANSFTLKDSTGNGAYVADTGSVVLAQKGQTIDRPKTIGSLNELITFLQTSGTIPKPTGSIYLGAHASVGGHLGLKMYRNQAFDEKKGTITEFETLEDTLKPAGTPNLPPLAKRTIKVPSALVGNPASRPPLMVHIRGCDIGRSEPFMTKWKEALGANAGTTASKLEHGVVDGSDELDDPYGSWEYYMYAFYVRRPAPRPIDQDEKDKVTPIRSRDELVQAFREAKEFQGDLTGDTYKFIDGTVVSDVLVGGKDLWSQWIPKDEDVFNNASPEPLRHKLLEKVGIKGTLSLQWRLARLKQQKQFQLLPPLAPPIENNTKDRVERLKNALATRPEWGINHDFAMYKRAGYFTIDDYFDGWTWTSTVTTGSGGTGIDFVGERIVYIMFVPVSSPNPGPNPNNSNLLFNFFPSSSSSPPAVIHVRSDDQRFFTILT